MRTKTISIFFLLAVSINFIKADWQAQTSGVTNDLLDVFFVNESTGWVCGLNGRILFTTNGGTLWGQQVSNTANVLHSIDFPSALTGYAVGGPDGPIVKTTNGGATWSAGSIPSFISITGVDFADNNTGYVCGSDGKTARTTNGGVNWTTNTITVNTLNTIYTIDANTSITAGISGLVFKTTNGGANWVQQTTGSNNFVSSIVFADNNNGYFTALGLAEEVRRTTNGGTNWSLVTSPGNSSGLNGLSVVNAATVYGVGPAGKVRRTTNSGTTWETQPTVDTTSYLWSIFMVNSNVGYIVGNNGRILKTLNGGIGIQQISTTVPKGFNLQQNYPNPFNPVTNIIFSIPKTGFAKLTVYDASGREAAVLFNGELSAGSYKYDFDASDYSSGIYFYRLEANDFTQTKKMILVK